MIYRKLDINGDYSMGHGASDWLSNSPATVAQAITTSLKLFQGEWFVNTSDGLPLNEIMGFNNILQCDYVISATIAGTPGFKDFVDYTSYYNPVTRTISPVAIIDTIYGQITYNGAFNV